MSRGASALPPCVVDNMVLAMFVDAGQAALLPALAGGSVYVSPSILDPDEPPLFSSTPVAEFSQGLYRLQGLALTSPTHVRRLESRLRFFYARPFIWMPVQPTKEELAYAQHLVAREARLQARALNPNLKAGRVDEGEAECAAVAVRRGWRLWSDDNSIVALVRALHPTCVVERTCGLVARAVNEGLLTYTQGFTLYESVFKSELGLYSKTTLEWRDGSALCV